MSTESQYPDARAERRGARARTPDTLAEGNAKERADIEEDRRRQRQLDDAELGGEA